MGKDMILVNAGIQAVLGISWRNNKEIVKNYIRASNKRIFLEGITDANHSWCGDFAFWVLKESGISPLPPFAAPIPGSTDWNTVSRYADTYPTFKPGEGVPEPGDMYYMTYRTLEAKKDGKATNHVGFVVEFDPNSKIFKSVDGNTGNNPAILVKGMTGAYVAYNQRNIGLVDFFIRIPK